MPPERSTKRVDHIALGRQIELSGKIMAPCTRCENANCKDCVSPRDPKLTRCGRCARLNKTCDVRTVNRMPTALDWESLDSQIEKLDAEEEEAMAKILRLKKQKRFLYERRQKMIAAGLNSMEELDALEALEKEAEEKRKAEEAQKSAELAGAERPSSGDVDPPYDPTVGLPFDPEDPLWADLGFVDGNWQAASGSEGLT
ncbi:hypothetical protein ONS95_000744 [Cadophora gregata]|uniref:uncharacterized protein n=1 Tax=Cadophora gregata TaxID=51156 RepID=UPI0026DAEE7C|nr:uncharacterized protein ONS95_011783 [Cadophora gregata]XP_058349186.1 uncharacterized protein ONS95_008462 [Cadophora gregata]XP_058352089.1 uncharacterized protein ONS95_005177 [Cadophora gregata]XP_058352155.1 uncharacterized protein ONS95_005241 [Cadophora gregata]XP_058358083.1 uncharacterized protein ONS95_011957 [Cadophora gregata]XP_058361597.1 uncharacterized protein ONS95_009098 [Cadophora gregata]XP_058363190.1 uncharacterized protein ONS95_008315 [Cadophora gregata]XP_05836411